MQNTQKSGYKAFIAVVKENIIFSTALTNLGAKGYGTWAAYGYLKDPEDNSLLVGVRPAHEHKCFAEGKTSILAPISDITVMVEKMSMASSNSEIFFFTEPSIYTCD